MAHSSRFKHRLKVLGRLALERNPLAASRMCESKRPRMKHRARRFDPRTRVVANVNALADQRMAELGQVDSNLMLAAGFEAALDQRRVFQQSRGGCSLPTRTGRTRAAAFLLRCHASQKKNRGRPHA